MSKKIVRQYSGCMLILFGISFALTSIYVVSSIAVGHDLFSIFIDEDGESTLRTYKLQFWIAIVAGAIFLIAGGKISKLRIMDNFPYEEDEDKETDNP